MKGRRRFAEEQITGVLHEHEAGVKAVDPCRKHRILPPTPRPQNEPDAADDPPVVDGLHTPRLVPQHRPQPRQLPVIPPELARNVALPMPR